MTIVDINGSFLLRRYEDNGQIVNEHIGPGSDFRNRTNRGPAERYSVYYRSDSRYASFNGRFVGPIFLVRESDSKIDAIFQLVRNETEVVYHSNVAGRLSRGQIDAATSSKREVTITYGGPTVSIS
jgi:hypothetical protein